MLIVVSAPSGSGKTTLVEHLLEKMEGIKRSVSYTTREPRQNEENEKDYIFISREEFKQKIENNEFVEWEENFGNYYGTLKEQIKRAIEEDADIILSIDVRGGRSIKKEFPQSISIFIMPPSMKELEKRLRERKTDGQEQVALRLKEAEVELEDSDEYDYMIVNDDIEKAVEELELVISKERNNRRRNKKQG